MTKWLKHNKVLAISIFSLLCGLTLMWAIYGLFGHRLIEQAYENQSLKILNRLMAGKNSTPLENYYKEADRLMWTGTLRVLTLSLVVMLLLKTQLLGKTVLLLLSFFTVSLSLFYVLETYPSLIARLRLTQIEYFAYRLYYVPDPTLVFRNRPGLVYQNGDFHGDKYSPLYGVHFEPIPYFLNSVDQEGFTEANGNNPADIVVIGDSFIEFALNSEDSFGRRLARISGFTVASLAVGGYGPFQYLELLKNYGIKKTPKYALFCFFEANDLGDIRNYLRWRQGGDYYYFTAVSKTFSQRYFLALTATARHIKSRMFQTFQLVLDRNRYSQNDVHDDLAVLRLRNDDHKVLLFYKNNPRSTDEIIQSAEWNELRNILNEFKIVSQAHGITPIVLYIPSATHIYAEFSTEQSGENWLKRRAQELAAKSNLELAMITLAKSLGIEMIDLSPIFVAAAKNGKLLYYPFDTHWNSEGREVAAAFVSKHLDHKPSRKGRNSYN